MCRKQSSFHFGKGGIITLDAPCEIIWTLTPFLRRTLNAWHVAVNVNDMMQNDQLKHFKILVGILMHYHIMQYVRIKFHQLLRVPCVVIPSQESETISARSLSGKWLICAVGDEQPQSFQVLQLHYQAPATSSQQNNETGALIKKHSSGAVPSSIVGWELNIKVE